MHTVSLNFDFPNFGHFDAILPRNCRKIWEKEAKIKNPKHKFCLPLLFCSHADFYQIVFRWNLFSRVSAVDFGFFMEQIFVDHVKLQNH